MQEPLLDEDADNAAALFGLARFAIDETGTSVVIVDPVFDDPAEDMLAIAWAITWHAWPKMIAAKSSMDFAVSWLGEPIAVPDPAQTPPLDGFVAAYLKLDSAEELECYRPEQRLGRLSLHRQLVRAEHPTYPDSFEPPITSPVHHVALMRAPHFVVKYHVGDPLAGDAAEYAGVFEAESGIDDVFARAEPPTHDDWIAKSLTGSAKTFVNTAFRRLNERLSAFARPTTIEIVGQGGIPLGAASAQFAALVATAQEHGGKSPPGKPLKDSNGSDRPKKTTRTSHGSIEEVNEPEFGEFRGEPALLFSFRVRRAESGTSVSAHAAVGVDESMQEERASETPTGAGQPQILGWVGPEATIMETERLPTEGLIGQIWKVAISPAPDTVTAISLSLVDGS